MTRGVWAAMVASACGGEGPETGSQTASYAGPYDLVTVETDLGRIEVVAGDTEGVELEFLPNGSDAWTGTEDGGTLALVAACFGDEVAGCGGGFVLTVGAGQAVEAKTGNGELVFGAGLGGALGGQTSSGALRAVDLGGASLELLTGTGAVDVSLAETPAAVSIDTGSSHAGVAVPAGGYALDLDTNGETDVDAAVTDDPDGPVLRVHSGTGNVTVSAY